jgi:hypothetical protein
MTHVLDDEGRSVMDPLFCHELQSVITQQSSMLDTSNPALDSVSGSFIGITVRRHQSTSLPVSVPTLITRTHHHSDRITNGSNFRYSKLASCQFVCRR